MSKEYTSDDLALAVKSTYCSFEEHAALIRQHVNKEVAEREAQVRAEEREVCNKIVKTAWGEKFDIDVIAQLIREREKAKGLVEALEHIKRHDISHKVAGAIDAFDYGGKHPNLGVHPNAGSRWATPRELADAALAAAPFAHKDGKGFTVQLRAFPINASLVLREPKEDGK